MEISQFKAQLVAIIIIITRICYYQIAFRRLYTMVTTRMKYFEFNCED